MAKEMGLDRAPIEFRKLVFLVPPIKGVVLVWVFFLDVFFQISLCEKLFSFMFFRSVMVGEGLGLISAFAKTTHEHSSFISFVH